MQKIMFNDKYGLTDAVLEGRKTMTRRNIPEMVGRVYKKEPDIVWDHKYECFLVFKDNDDVEPILLYPKYKIGEVVSVAQAYCYIKEFNPESYEDVMLDDGAICAASHPYSNLMSSAGWDNKMFVRAELMQHQIRITNVRVERLQDISAEDCLKEGIVKACGLYGCEGVCERGDQLFFSNPREAFAALIDKVSGKGTFDSNPWVFVYEFELVK